MEPSATFAFVAIAFTLIAIPGPDWAYVLAAGARDHVVVPPVAGILLGYALVSAGVVGGFAALVTTFPAALLLTNVAGASYLTYLGIKVLRSPTKITEAGGQVQRPSTLRSFGRGVGVSALNPKGLLILASVTQGFTRPDATLPLTAQLAVLCALYILLCAAVYLPLALAADRVLGARPAVAQVTTRVAAVSMILVGGVMVAERILHALSG